MSLSSELISQFAKITNDKTEVKQESTHYGTTVEYDGSMYVQLDGSDLLTPISTTADTKAGERVMVLIKNHTATITGNLSSPAARTGTVTELDGKVTNLGSQISEFEVIIADKVDTVVLQAVVGRVDQLTSDNVIIKEHLDANTADIDSLEADNVVINEKLTAAEGDIKKLNTEKLSAEEAEIKFANIDFSNIGTAAIEEFLAKSGLIDDLTVGDGIVTGKLVGVTIIGDLIEGGTVKADKLVVKGTDGIYYKLNFEGGNFAEGEAVPNDSLHGSIITAKSITAEKVSVKDLVAFGATIGGFKITDNAIHSVAKTSATNATRGLYMDNEGQMSFGDTTRYLKYYKDQNGVWHLEIAADDILFGADGESVDTVLRGVTADVDEVKAKAEKAQSDAEAANAAAERVQARAEAAETAATTAQTKADEAKAKAEQAEANLTEVSSRVDATEEEIELATLAANTAKAEAEAAQSQADTAKAQAEQAKTDAENAKTVANAAQSAADKAQADVNALATRVTNAETAISQNSEAIELRATKTEVDTALTDVNSRVDKAVKEHHRYYLSQEASSGSDTLTWDGNTDGLESFDGAWFKVSDVTPSFADFANGYTAEVYMPNEGFVTIDDTMLPITIVDIGDKQCVAIGEFGFVAHETITLENELQVTKGIYLVCADGVYGSSLTIPGYTGFGTDTPTPEKPTEFPPESAGSDTLTWDGNTEGLEVFDLFGFPTYKVTDVSITLNELSNGGSIIYSNDNESNVMLDFPSDRLQVMDVTEESGVGMYVLYFHNALPIGFIFPENCELSGDGLETITINKGVYLPNDVETYMFVSSLTISGYTGFVGAAWIETEPEYVSGNNVYTVSCDVYIDDTFIYSEVSKMSSYDGVKSTFETILEAKSDLSLAQQNLQNLEARAGTTEEELKSAKQEVANAQAAVDAAMEDLLITKQTVASLTVKSDEIYGEVEKIVKNGVEQVKTSMGYTFNDEGLHIQKPDGQIKNTLDDEGMMVTSDGQVMLQADKDGVIATDVKVRNYLIIGKHARFEDYNDGTDSKRTACFWVDL